ncbi:MAG TPA: bifunctional UDP-N-acetylglucosamine diphosphorylase/glucosamine-1-phosphate N-acetyltransferase GlmU [Firmicutes bacterium]|jgi:bifunctional UDP-N-acetylglucosamine pyrophosphorylase/glucosamine-1-phosphate N-acetyltransferase|nr:bifunctional UDP-N-acetylglucosamine diphosphorylase/glucosamine-1-phosphate N-acetyltransferase GlmU [Bacillota bacterium]
MKLFAIILAAGKGTRMKSLDDNVSKVSYPLLGRPLVGYMLEALKPINCDRKVTIVGFGGETTKSIVEAHSEIVWQRELKGTGHAIMQVAPLLENEEGTTLIVSGDTPLFRTETLQKLLGQHQSQKSDLTILTALLDNPAGYGRIIRDAKGEVTAIIEQADATIEQEKIKEINAGVYVFDNRKLFDHLKHLKPFNKQGEYYLTDLIAMFKQSGDRVSSHIVDDFKETLGINDRVQLAEATKIMRRRINTQLMKSGVTIEDPDNTYIGPDVVIGQDTTIKPGCYIMGTTIIGNGNTIGPDTTLENMKVGHHNTIIKSYLTDSSIGDHNKVGPFTHMRGHTEVESNTRVGNFVEMKSATMHNHAKAAHLTYLGDAEIGEETNIGCGTITANYDGKNKWKTIIGKRVFVGSGTTIIAPVNIGDDAFIAAGSTINHDVPSDDMAIARARQENKPGFAMEIRKRIAEKSIK